MVKHFCRSNRGATVHDEDDIVQQVCEKILSLGEKKLSAVDNEEAYLFRTVRNCCIDRFKSRKREMAGTVDIFTDNLIDLIEDTRSVGKYDAAEIGEMIAAVHEIIDGFSSMKQVIAIMYFLEGCTETAIARNLGKAQSTIAGHVADIKRRLCVELKRRFPGCLGGYLTDQ